MSLFYAGLISHYTFNSNASDSLGRNNASLSGAVISASGKFASCVKFDGTDDYVSLGDSLNNFTDIFRDYGDGRGAFTFAAWVKPTALNSASSNHGVRNLLFSEAGKSGNDNLEIGIREDGSIDVYIDDSVMADDTHNLGSGVSVDQWNHIVVVFSANEDILNVYVNGNEYQASGLDFSATFKSIAGSPIALGTTRNTDIRFQGFMDEVSIWRQPLMASDAIALYNSGDGIEFSSYSEGGIRDNLEYYNTMDDDDGIDSILEAAPITMQATAASGKLNNGLAFNDDYLTLFTHNETNYSLLVDLTAITVSFWVKFDNATIGSHEAIIQYMDWNYDYGWEVYRYATTEKIRFAIKSNNTVISASAVNDTDWHHVVGRFDEDTGVQSITVDNVTTSETPGGSINWGGNKQFYIGNGARTGLVGTIDEVGIWSRYLTDDEVTSLYNSGGAFPFPFANPAVAPTVLTRGASQIQKNTLSASGVIDSDGNANITAWGFYYSASDSIPTASNLTASGDGSGSEGVFNVSLSGLTKNTNYYMRAFATNEEGTGYGSVIQVLTANDIPTIYTRSIYNMDETEASASIYVKYLGDSNITQYGFQFSKYGETAASSWASSGSLSASGVYVVNITGMEKGTKYDFRAFAVNNEGEDYGSITTKRSAYVRYGILLYYNFENNLDEVFDIYNASGIAVSYASGIISKAVQTSSASSYVHIVNASEADEIIGNERSGKLTYMMWIRSEKESGSANATILTRDKDNFWALQMDQSAISGSQDINLILNDGTNLSKTNASINKFYFVCFTLDYDNGIANFYVDGSLVASNSDLGVADNIDKSVFLGRDYDNSNKFVGSVDELGVWNKILYNSEIIKLYNSGSGFDFNASYDFPLPVYTLSVDSIKVNELVTKPIIVKFGNDAVKGKYQISASIRGQYDRGLEIKSDHSYFEVENELVTDSFIRSRYTIS